MNDAEKHARMVAAALLQEAVRGARPPDRTAVDAFRSLPISDVISLNFESAWNDPDTALRLTAQPKERLRFIKHAKKAGVTKGEACRLHDRQTSTAGFQIWYPNGHLAQPQTSLRLGLRDFGLQPRALEFAVRQTKAWEAKQLGLEPRLTTKSVYLLMLRRLRNPQPSALANADHWVTPFVLRPLFLLGVGMSPIEQGLWWLLVQRRRNFARVKNPPPTYILLKRKRMSPEQQEFWDSGPAGILPLWCDEWVEGWDLAHAAIERVGQEFGSRDK